MSDFSLGMKACVVGQNLPKKNVIKKTLVSELIY